jgi:flavorubredoxin
MPLFPLLVIVLVFLFVVVAWRLYRMAKALIKTVLVAALVILIVGVALLYLVTSQEVVSSIEVLNRGGDQGTALVVYHPGLTGFHERVTSAFADGLVSNGWRVEMTTASPYAPTDLSSYDLLVLGGPTYFWTPNRPIKSYLSRLGDLGGKRTAIIITSLGMGDRSISTMERLVRAANGDLLKSLLLYSLAPNEDIYGMNDPEEIASQVAKGIMPPGR